MVDGTREAGAASLLAGRRVLVATQGLAIGRSLAQGLLRHGARVVEVDAVFDSRATAELALGEAARSVAGADLVVHAAAMPAALASGALADLSLSDWDLAVHRGALATLFCLQAAHGLLHSRGGTVVVVGPSVALVGAAGLVPLMTLAEGQRALVKSAARQWGRHGMRLNWVGVAARHFSPALADAALPLSPELGNPPPALGQAAEPQAAVADVLAWLGSDGGRGVTGASFNLDGGDWMVP